MKTVNSSVKPFQSVCYTLFRNKLLISVSFLVVSSSIVYKTITATPIFEEEARLVVGIGREFIGLDPALVDEPRLAVFQSREYEINQEIAELTSRAHIGEVVDILSPEYILGGCDEPPAEAADLLGVRPQLSAGVSKVEPIPASSRNQYSPSRPKGVFRRLLNLVGVSKQVSLRERAMLRFQKNFNAKSAYNSNVITLSYRDTSPLRAHRILQATVRIHMQDRSGHQNTAESYSFFSVETSHLAAELEKAEHELRDLRSRSGVVSVADQKSVLLQRLNRLKESRDTTEAEIAASQAAMRVMDYNLDPKLYAEQARLESLLAKQKTLLPQVQQLEQELNRLNETEFQIRQLERQVEIYEKNLKKYQESLELARINRALEKGQITNLTVYQDPFPQEEPVSPQTKRDIFLGLLLGVLVGVSLAFLREQMDPTLRNFRKIEEEHLVPSVIALPRVQMTTGRTPMYPKQRGQRGESSSSAVFSPSAVAWFDALIGFREPLLRLKEDLEAWMGDRPSSVIAMTSFGRAEGVTTVATGIACTFADSEPGKVLLVDANLHRVKGNRFSELKRLPGSEERSIVCPEWAPENLPEGVAIRHHRLQSIAALLPTIRIQDYRLILLDLPAVSEGSSVFRAAAQSDGILLVVQSESVRKETVLQIKYRIEKLGGCVIGIVLNKYRSYIPGFLTF